MGPLSLFRVIRFGVFEVDVRTGEVHKNGVQVKLQEQPFQVLAALLERPGEMVTREELRQRLWPSDTFVDFDNSVNAAVNRLREALGDSAENPRFVQTLPRRGYRFIAPVETADHDSPGAVTSSPLPSPIRETVPTAPTAMLPRSLQFWVASIAITATLLSLSVYRWKSGRVARGPIAGSIRSIAVLPLENLTGDPGQEYFVDGMTDALITDLAQIRSLRVISRTSVMQYKRARKSLPEIARELNVDTVLEGSVVRSGEQVRIDAQLIRAANDQHLWAKSYQRQLQDVVMMQNEIARAVVQEVQLQLTPQEETRLKASRPVNPDAYEDYLRGHYYRRKWTSEGTAKAFEYFQKATKEDPNYAPAYASLAEAEWGRAFPGRVSPREAAPLAAQAATKALELDESLAQAHDALASIKYRFQWDWAGAEKEYSRALELNPNGADGHWQYAMFLRTANRYQEAIAEAKRAKELDPVPSVQRAGLGSVYLIARKYDLAIEELRRVVALYPEHAIAYHLLGVAYEQKRLPREAISAFEECVKISKGDSTYLAMLAHAYALFGRRQDAEKILAQLQGRAKREYVSPHNIALVWLGLGNHQQALAWLEKAYLDRSFSLVTINSWPWFDPLRSDPQFQDLVRRIGLDPQRAIPNQLP